MRPPRPSAREALIAALAARGGTDALVRPKPSRSWASATFAGARHEMEIRLPARSADAFEQGLKEAQFSLRGHLLADIAIAGRRTEGEAVVLDVEALTIEES